MMVTLRDFLKSVKIFNDYPIGETRFIYEFVDLPQLKEIFAPFNLAKVAGEGDTFAKARRIMQWVADNTSYDGASPLGPALPEKIIGFGIREKNPINCANRSILFCDALVSIGIFALPFFLENRPYLTKIKKLSNECHVHVIAQVWLPEMQCWAAFDPSFNAYFTVRGSSFVRSAKCKPVSVPEMAIMKHTWRKVRLIDNKTGKHQERSALCTKIGLLMISVLPGNNFQYRCDFNRMYYLIPQSYLEILKTNDESKKILKEKFPESLKITVGDLSGVPMWKKQ